MDNHRLIGLLVLLSIALVACDKKPYEPPEPATGGSGAAVLLAPQKEALDRAKDVNRLTEQQDQATRQAIDRDSR